MPANRLRPLSIVLLAAVLVAGAMAVGSAASSHESDGDGSQDTSYLRVVHAAPDAPAVDVYLDGEPALTDVSFGDVGPYVALPAGSYEVAITAAGDPDATVLETDVTLEPRTVTTVAAAGEVSEDGTQEFGLRAFSDDALAPGENDSAVRVVHLSPDAPTVDVTAEDGSVVLAENVSFGNASDYVTVPAGDYTVEIREDTPEADGSVVATADVSLAGGTVYSAWALGYVDPDDAPADEPFAVAATEDASMTVNLPSTATPDGNETATATATATPTETS